MFISKLAEDNQCDIDKSMNEEQLNKVDDDKQTHSE